MDAAYALIGPLALFGVVSGVVLSVVVPQALPAFRRPYTLAWAVASLGLGGAMFLDEIVVQEAPLSRAVLAALGTSTGLAVLIPLIWARVHMWDHVLAREERRRQADRNARYRAKDFSD